LLLKIGEKVHIMNRRAFVGDLRRHFVGEITDVSDTAIRVKGYSFIFDEGDGEYHRKPELRIRIFSLIDGRTIINVIPPLTEIEKVIYRLSEEDNLVATDGEHFRLDINEFGIRR
jgi:hypothetical protein